MRDTYHATTLNIRGDVNHSGGMASRYDDGRTAGHVTIYTNAGSLTIASDSIEGLRSLGEAFHRAANQLDAMRTEVSA